MRQDITAGIAFNNHSSDKADTWQDNRMQHKFIKLSPPGFQLHGRIRLKKALRLDRHELNRADNLREGFLF